MEVLIKLSDAIKTLKSMAVPLVRKLPSAQPERLTDYSFEESCTECPAYDTENHRCPRFNQVIRTVLKDANLEPCEDCISRQAAIDALADMHCKSDEDGYVWIIRSDAWARIDALPSAQPEIIRCKDCKYITEHYDTDGNVPYWTCSEWDSGTDYDGFCHYAERRADDSISD